MLQDLVTFTGSDYCLQPLELQKTTCLPSQVEIYENQRDELWGEPLREGNLFDSCKRGGKVELLYLFIEGGCGDGMVQRVYIILYTDKVKILTDLYHFYGGTLSSDDTLNDHQEHKLFMVYDFFVIRWCRCNFLASPYFFRTGGMLVDWIIPFQAKLRRKG